jgi:hypothetical protein
MSNQYVNQYSEDTPNRSGSDPRYHSRSSVQEHPTPHHSALSPPELTSHPRSYLTPQDGRFATYSGDMGQYYNLSTSLPYGHGPSPPIHYFPPPLNQDDQDRARPSLSLDLPPPSALYDPGVLHRSPLGYGAQVSPDLQKSTAVNSPFQTPLGLVNSDSTSGSAMTDYFPPLETPLQQHQPLSPAWPPQQHAVPVKSQRREGAAKTTRQQFTACGACRHRRVKCDLKDRQERAENLATIEEDDKGLGPQSVASSAKRKRVSCTNCQERGTNCV